MRRILPLLALFPLLLHSVASAASLLGAWRLDDGRLFTLAPSAEDSWRYRFIDNGHSGRLYRQGEVWVGGDGFANRTPVALNVSVTSPEALRWSPHLGAAQNARRVALLERDVVIDSGTVRLHARMVLPATPGPHPAVVLVHGSERSAAVGYWHEPYYLAAHGIGALVYDKRGTGRSGGAFSADFQLLAQDAAAVANWLVAQPEADAQRIGFAGYSQGGWVAPLAAERFGAARAVLIGYGSVHSPLHEDRFQCLADVQASGADGAALQEADLLVSAAHTLLRSDSRDGWDEFTRRSKLYAQRDWFKRLDGQRCIAAGFAAYPAWIIRTFARSRLPPGINWAYDSETLLARLNVPMLWLLAADDREAPVADTAATLQALAAKGKPYTVRIFPQTDHGILRFRVEHGKRVSTGYDPDYLRATLAFWRQHFDLGRPGR